MAGIKETTGAINGALNKLGGGTKGQYLTLKDFSTDFLDTIANLTINAGDAFLNGMPSSAFNNANDVQQLDNALSSSLNAASNVVDSVAQIKTTDFNALGDEAAATAQAIPKIMGELTTNCATAVTKELALYSTEKLTQILDPTIIVSAFTYYTTYYMQIGLQASGDLLKKLTTPQDTAIEDEIKEADEKKKSEKIEKMQEKISQMKEKTTTVVSDIKEGINTIKPYIKQGPDILIGMANSYIDYGINIVESYIDFGANWVIGARDAMIESIGEYLGEGMVISINKTTEKTLKKQLEKASTEIKSITFKGVNTMMAAVQLVVSQLGPILGKIVKMGVQQGVKMLVSKIPL